MSPLPTLERLEIPSPFSVSAVIEVAGAAVGAGHENRKDAYSSLPSLRAHARTHERNESDFPVGLAKQAPQPPMYIAQLNYLIQASNF